MDLVQRMYTNLNFVICYNHLGTLDENTLSLAPHAVSRRADGTRIHNVRKNVHTST
jgi:hypothetical protein